MTVTVPACPAGEMILSDGRVQVAGNHSSLYRYNMTLTIAPVRDRDFTSYRCIAKNSIGEAEGAITLHSKCEGGRRRPFDDPITDGGLGV